MLRAKRTIHPLILGGLLIWMAAAAEAVEMRFISNNDFLTTNPTNDDLYSFSIEFQVDHGRWTYTFDEEAFTDKAAGTRFDETHLTAGREVRLFEAWQSHLTFGVIHVGRGLFGQDAQNVSHNLLGNEELDLDYVDSDRVYPTARLELYRPYRIARDTWFGPQVELDTAPGYQSHVLAGVRASKQVHPTVALEVFGGGRLSETSFEALEPWIVDSGAAAEVVLTFREKIQVAWSFNEYGTERQHMRIGYRVLGGGRSPRR